MTPRIGILVTSVFVAIATIVSLCFVSPKETPPVFYGQSTSSPAFTAKQADYETAAYWDNYQTTYSPMYESQWGEIESADIQCPIPMSDRVPNYTGIQCVWSSLEMLGRWAEEPKLMNPPLTSRPDCKSYSSPSLVATRLKQLGVKYEQSYQDRGQSIALIKKAMAEHRGCLWGVPGHAMVLVHYDEAADVVKWVDNSDSTLKVQTTNIAGFNRRWDTWVCVIYADNDIIPMKTGLDSPARKLPIVDRNNPQGKYPKDYIPLPNNAVPSSK